MKLPDIHRKEWRQLLTGEIDVPLKNFFFQMKVTQARNFINQGRIPLEDAVKDIYNLCSKFSNANHLDEDLKAIFKTEQTQHSTVTEVNGALPKEETINMKRKTASVAEQIQKIKDQAEKNRKELEKAIAERKRIETLLRNEKMARERLLKERKNGVNAEYEKLILEERLKKERLERAEQERKRIEKIRNIQKNQGNNTEITSKDNPNLTTEAKDLHNEVSQKNKSDKPNDVKEKDTAPKKNTIGSFFRSIFITD